MIRATLGTVERAARRWHACRNPLSDRHPPLHPSRAHHPKQLENAASGKLLKPRRLLGQRIAATVHRRVFQCTLQGNSWYAENRKQACNDQGNGPNQATMYVSRCGLYFVANVEGSPAKHEHIRTRRRLVQPPLRWHPQFQSFKASSPDPGREPALKTSKWLRVTTFFRIFKVASRQGIGHETLKTLNFVGVSQIFRVCRVAVQPEVGIQTLTTLQFVWVPPFSEFSELSTGHP